MAAILFVGDDPRDPIVDDRDSERDSGNDRAYYRSGYPEREAGDRGTRRYWDWDYSLALGVSILSSAESLLSLVIPVAGLRLLDFG